MSQNKKLVGICGASDCFPDPDWPGISWMEKLEVLISPHCEVRYFSVEGASNFLISLQVEKAIEECDIVIVNFTSSVRDEYRVGSENTNLAIFDRLYRYHLTNPNITSSLVCSSGLTVEKNPVLDARQKRIIKEFFTEFHDMQVAVKKNSIFIHYALNLLKTSNKKFIFSTGGFEHSSYLPTASEYSNAFDEFDSNRSLINLWDYITDFRRPRPYFHITDSASTSAIAKYYQEFIQSRT